MQLQGAGSFSGHIYVVGDTYQPPKSSLKVLLQEVVLHALPDVPPVDDHVVVPAHEL